jgi:hypothetical protein
MYQYIVHKFYYCLIMFMYQYIVHKFRAVLHLGV